MKVKIVALDEDAELCKVQLPTHKCDSCTGDCVLQAFSEPDWNEAQRDNDPTIGQLWVANEVKRYVCGDTAELLISSHALILAALIVFVVPVMFMVVPVAIASFLGLSENFLYAVSVLGLICGAVVAVLLGIQMKWSEVFDVHLQSIEPKNEP